MEEHAMSFTWSGVLLAGWREYELESSFWLQSFAKRCRGYEYRRLVTEFPRSVTMNRMQVRRVPFQKRT